MLHVSSFCTPCCISLGVVESYCVKFETVQTLSYVQTDATTPNNVGSSWPECRAHLYGALACDQAFIHSSFFWSANVGEWT